MHLEAVKSDIAVKQANKLIESIYRMDVNEHKLLLLATKKVNEMELQKKPFNERTKITISASEFAHQYSISRQSAFDIIIEAKKSIYDREFDYLHVDEKGNVSQMKSRWLQARQVDKLKSEISFMFASAVIPLIYLVKNEYTLLDLGEIGQLKSKYAVRLYKYLMRWVNAPFKNKIPIEEIRVIFGLNEDEYPEMRDLRKRVLDIAVKQVKENTGFKDLKLVNHKQGVKVVAFSFVYSTYENEFIKKQAKVQVVNEESNTETEDLVIYQMSPPQIEAFSQSIATKVTKNVPGFGHLAELVQGNQPTSVLAEKIKQDFMNRVFEPYYSVLQLLDFKATKINKTPLSAENSENSENKTGVSSKPKVKDQKAAPKPPQQTGGRFDFDHNFYNNVYVKKGGIIEPDQIVEIAMAEDVTTTQVMIDNLKAMKKNSV